MRRTTTRSGSLPGSHSDRSGDVPITAVLRRRAYRPAHFRAQVMSSRASSRATRSLESSSCWVRDRAAEPAGPAAKVTRTSHWETMPLTTDSVGTFRLRVSHAWTFRHASTAACGRLRASASLQGSGGPHPSALAAADASMRSPSAQQGTQTPVGLGSGSVRTMSLSYR
jgi:hypothetical protein